MPLAGWKTTVDRSDVEDVLVAVASLSDGRVGQAEVAEVLDALAHTDEGCARAFRFGKARSFGQIWIGVVPAPSSCVKLFVLASHAFVEALEQGLSVAGFAGAKRDEYELLRRFFLAAWDWQWSAAPFAPELRAAKPQDFDPTRTAESMGRVLSSPGSPLLELLRGLRRRTRELLEETGGLAQAEVEAADAYLAGQGAATLSEMRRRYLGAASPTAAS